MKQNQNFDEVMIVNPYDPRSNNQPTTLMRFHQVPEMGYYAEPPELGYYGEAPEAYGYYAQAPELGWYGQAPDAFGWYAEPPELGYYAENPEAYGSYAEPPELGWYGEAPDGYGWYAEPPELGYYAEFPELGQYGYGAYQQTPEMGHYAEPPEMAEYAEPVEYYAEEPGPIAGYGYGHMPEMVGYNEYEPLSEDYPGVSQYGEPEIAGYVRQARPSFNPGCPMPTNVAGFAEAAPLEGYVRPAPVSPTCEQFSPPPDPGAGVPDTFRPLW